MAGAPAPAIRLAAALAASACLHGALLAGLGRLPQGTLAGSSGQPWTPHPVRVRVIAEDAPTAVATPEPPAPRAHAPRPAPTAEAKEGQATATTPGVASLARYYTAAELDQRPMPRTAIEPEYPALALSPVGRVTIALYISEDGEVDRVEVEATEGIGQFAESARKAFAAARYLPGQRGGVAVKSLMRIEVRFGEAPPAPAAGQDSVKREPFVPKVRVRPTR